MKTDSLYLISIDIGTTHTKAVLYLHGTGIVCQESEGYDTYYPRPGWVEQDPDEILRSVLNVTRRLVQKSHVAPGSIGALVFTGIVQSLIPVAKDGHPLDRASTWADMRSLTQNERLKLRLDSEEVKQRTGCTLHPMYFPSRLAWMKQETPEVFQSAVHFISIKEYIIAHLFGVYQVDYSVASGSGLWNMHTRNWDAALLQEVGLSADRFSECIEPTAYISGGLLPEAAASIGLLAGTPGIIGAFDGAQSHLGSVGTSDERMSLTVGTGAALRRRMPTPRVIPGSEAWCYYMADDNWLLGGVIHDAGNAMRWFADNLMDPSMPVEQIFEEMNRLANQVPAGADGLFFLPLFGGDRCPHYRPDARGAVTGLTFSHGRGHLVRALMEGLAYHLFSVYRMLAPHSEPDLVVTGGILKSPIWLKIVSDLFGKVLYLPGAAEATAWGGVLIALRALGELDSLHGTSAFLTTSGMQQPEDSQHEVYRRLIAEYDEVYKKLFG